MLFDKRLCHAALAGAGVPVPESPTSAGRTPVRGWDDVRALLDAHAMPRAFLKPAHGSSASGIVALETAGHGRIRATTSVETAGRRTPQLPADTPQHQRTGDRRLVDALAPDGLHIERWWPSGVLGAGRVADLRVLVVAGRATHAVVRTSRAPMTNLHLGGARGDLSAAADAMGPRWADALDVCERAAACFPGTLCVGVDLLPATGWRRFAVGEVNAFGDLLPGLTGLPAAAPRASAPTPPKSPQCSGGTHCTTPRGTTVPHLTPTTCPT